MLTHENLPWPRMLNDSQCLIKGPSRGLNLRISKNVVLCTGIFQLLERWAVFLFATQIVQVAWHI